MRLRNRGGDHRVYRTVPVAVCAVLLLTSLALAGTEPATPTWGPLPTSFDPPFTPQHITPDTATIALSPGFAGGRYDIESSLAETTLHESSQKPARNYKGIFTLHRIKLPTDDFRQLTGKTFRQVADEQAVVRMEFAQTPRQGETLPNPFGQSYPAVIDAIRFGPLRQHVLYTELVFRVDFAAGGPPHPWTKIAAITPYHLARMQVSYEAAGYPKEAWEAFCALVTATERRWQDAKYTTNVRLLLNHRYQSSMGMNTHDR